MASGNPPSLLDLPNCVLDTLIRIMYQRYRNSIRHTHDETGIARQLDLTIFQLMKTCRRLQQLIHDIYFLANIADCQWNPVNIWHGVHLMAFNEGQHQLRAVNQVTGGFETCVFQAFENDFTGSDAWWNAVHSWGVYEDKERPDVLEPVSDDDTSETTDREWYTADNDTEGECGCSTKPDSEDEDQLEFEDPVNEAERDRFNPESVENPSQEEARTTSASLYSAKDIARLHYYPCVLPSVGSIDCTFEELERIILVDWEAQQKKNKT